MPKRRLLNENLKGGFDGMLEVGLWNDEQGIQQISLGLDYHKSCTLANDEVNF